MSPDARLASEVTLTQLRVLFGRKAGDAAPERPGDLPGDAPGTLLAPGGAAAALAARPKAPVIPRGSGGQAGVLAYGDVLRHVLRVRGVPDEELDAELAKLLAGQAGAQAGPQPRR